MFKTNLILLFLSSLQIARAIEVSVCGDAIYDITGPICSGPSSRDAAGTNCPKKGDVATSECYKYLNSYSEYTSKCVAKEDAECRQIHTGAWGCVFPSVVCSENSIIPIPTQYPITQEPITQDPVTQEPVTQDPVTQEPVINDGSDSSSSEESQEPITQDPVTQEPVINDGSDSSSSEESQEPITQEPITQDPVTQEPVTQEPITQEPITQEPITQEPITQEPITQDPVTQEPVTQEPVTQEPGSWTLPEGVYEFINKRDGDNKDRAMSFGRITKCLKVQDKSPLVSWRVHYPIDGVNQFTLQNEWDNGYILTRHHYYALARNGRAHRVRLHRNKRTEWVVERDEENPQLVYIKAATGPQEGLYLSVVHKSSIRMVDEDKKTPWEFRMKN